MKRIMIAGWITPDEKYETYMEALKKLGAKPFLSLDEKDFARADGLILPGSSQDMNPKLWGEKDICSNDINDSLDSIQWRLMEMAAERKTPVLGICRGMQFINVFFGGTLIQELETSEFHKAPEDQESDNFHDVCIKKESFLYRLYGSNAEVNTRHHQGVGTIGSGLKVSALWKNGRMQVVEALEHETLPMIGLQWHPERMYIMSDGKRRRDGEIFLRNWLETVDSRKVQIHSSETPDNAYITYSEEGEKNVHMY